MRFVCGDVVFEEPRRRSGARLARRRWLQAMPSVKSHGRIPGSAARQHGVGGVKGDLGQGHGHGRGERARRKAASQAGGHGGGAFQGLSPSLMEPQTRLIPLTASPPYPCEIGCHPTT